MMPKKKGILLLAGAVLLAGGCAGPYYFDLQADVPARRGMAQVDKVLRIDRITISETYRDYRIVVRESPFRVKYAWFASWSRSPDELIGDAVLRFFGKRSVFRKVETIESGDDHDLEMRIRIEAIEKCLVGRRWYARLAMDVEIVDPESGALLLGHSFDRRERLEGKKTRLVPGKIAMILHEELLKIEARIIRGEGT